MSTKTVLVAEDRESSRELIRTMLEHSGYSVLEATNGAEAVVLTREKSPDLVFLDLQMPIKNGYDVLRELRSDPRFQSLPIVALTASAMYRDKEGALKSGFTGYLTKPLALSDLRKELSRLLPHNSKPPSDSGSVA
jgi:CheY-like chemotaxis protein